MILSSTGTSTLIALALNGALGDARDKLGFAYGNREPVVLIDMHHHRQIRAAVTHIDDVVHG